MILDKHPDDSPIYAKRTVRYIGFWCNAAHPDLPDPVDFIDQGWDDIEQRLVASFLAEGAKITQYRGFHTCLICGSRVGTADCSDEQFIWPEGFAHYVAQHAVRPPEEFVDHVKRTMTVAYNQTSQTGASMDAAKTRSKISLAIAEFVQRTFPDARWDVTIDGALAFAVMHALAGSRRDGSRPMTDVEAFEYVAKRLEDTKAIAKHYPEEGQQPPGE